MALQVKQTLTANISQILDLPLVECGFSCEKLFHAVKIRLHVRAGHLVPVIAIRLFMLCKWFRAILTHFLLQLDCRHVGYPLQIRNSSAAYPNKKHPPIAGSRSGGGYNIGQTRYHSYRSAFTGFVLAAFHAWNPTDIHANISADRIATTGRLQLNPTR